MSGSRATRTKVLTFALQLPEAYLDHPWGEDVVKVRGKVFAFMGTSEGSDPGMTVKLGESREQALASPGATPSAYGLGRAGWVTVPFAGAPPVAVLKDWLEESYRLRAPNRLAETLDDEIAPRPSAGKRSR